MKNIRSLKIANPKVALATLLFATSPIIANAQETNAVPKYDAATFFNTTDYAIAQSSNGAFSPDGNHLLITSNETGVFNAYELDLDSGETEQLTSSDSNATYAVSYFPDGERILFTADGGGDELNHLYVRDAEGNITDLTPGDNVKASFVNWVDDGDAFIVQSNVRDAKVFDLYKYNSEDYTNALIYKNELALGGLVTTKDGTIVAGAKERTSADSNIYIIDLKGNEIVPNLITSHEGNIAYGVYTFTPEDDKLVFSTDEFGEFTQAHTYDLASGETKPLITADWDVAYVTYSPSGKYRVSGINEDGSTKVKIAKRNLSKLSKRTKRKRLSSVISELSLVSLPDDLPSGSLSQVRFSPDEKSISFALNASNAPSNIFSASLKKDKLRQYTQALNKEIDPAHLVSSTVARYESFDGTIIPGILYQPKNASADNPVPAMVWVHGGPGGQSRTGYSAAIQHIVNNGYAVFAANNRGSSGYGKTFFHMDDKRHGEEDLQDIVEAKSYLASLDWIDGERIGIIGGSYGGYMTVAALTYHPEVFDLGIDIFGVTNWARTLASIPPWWESFRESLYDEMGDPATDAERHRRISPLFHAEKITKPLLVVQGVNDPRVLQVESDEIVEAVRANGVPVEYLVFEGEGHGFRKRENRIAASEAYVKFLDTYLKGDHAVSSPAAAGE